MIVGIGASAGGLEAFKSFFTYMPADCDMAFVLVQHLAPAHHSLLAELIGRSTTLTVQEAIDGEAVQSGHVYVIPPDATLTIAEGVLQVAKPAPPRQHRWPIDSFFMSLAEDQGDNAVCIVLSGSGSDGARGLRAINEHGGLVLAQAGFDHVAMTGMPSSAAATGLVDDVLPVEDMPARLLAHQRLLAARTKHEADSDREQMAVQLQTLCGVLRDLVGHDFSGYKDKTLIRRIHRRMQVTQIAGIADYVALLRRDPGECDLLFHELLINVTQFFRDEDAFEVLRTQVIPPLLANKGAGDDLRIWVPGCASGEEAYSIAILLREAIGSARQPPKVVIFATDIDDRAIDAARAGCYRAPLIGISPERAERWFTREGDNYSVVKAIREMCVFSSQSVIKDAPFSRLDLISCRNLMIYLNTDVQQRLVRLFHYALRPGGFLMLGPSEGISRNARLFSVVDKKHRLFARCNDVTAGVPDLPRSTPSAHATPRAQQLPDSVVGEDSLGRRARRVLDKYTPAYMVIDAHYDIQRFGGDVARYLGPTSGTASLHLFALLHRSLRAATRAVIDRAFATGAATADEGMAVKLDGQSVDLRVVADLLPENQQGGKLCVVVFMETGSPMAGTTMASSTPADESTRLRTLERELESTRMQLQAVLDQQETANEEMKSANEEYQSVNEELQSSNEELETSKEEMQSINEELQTVNAELQSKNANLTRINSDLRNLQESTEIATLFLDTELHIRTFTPAIADVFHLREGDRGRPVTEISARVHYPELAQDLAKVLRSLTMIERTLQHVQPGPIFQMRMRPYRTVDNVIDGVVLTFVDVTERERHVAERGLLSAIVHSSKDAIIGFTLEGIINAWNMAAEEMLGYTAAQAIGQPLAMLFADEQQAREDAVVDAVRKDLRAQEQIRQWRRADGKALEVVKMISPVCDANGHPIAGSIIARDNTERRNYRVHRDLMLAELNHRVKNTLATVHAIAQQTLNHSPTLDVFSETFLSRLLALSHTHNLLANDTWAGTGLRDIVLGELEPFQSDKNSRVEINGEALHITPKIALALSMALHELATNAVKYGALSVPAGRVTVNWETRDRHGEPWLQLRWIERGGPSVTLPTQCGFGTRLIKDGLSYELDGEVDLRYEPAGVVCDIAIPLNDAGKTGPSQL
jgi:two-component system, chemotaxis family, CheB/CheR fusion protein